MAHSDDIVLVHLVHRPCVACGSPSGRHAQRPAGWALVTCHTLSVTRTLALICVTGALYFLAKPWGRGSRLVLVRSRGLLLVDLFACSLLYVYLLIFLLLCPCYLYWLLFMSLLGCVLYSLVALWHAWTEILLLARDPIRLSFYTRLPTRYTFTAGVCACAFEHTARAVSQCGA